jgi:uncharacterized repeat protein (TIGR03803 family)
VIHSFAGGNRGTSPIGSLAGDEAGNLYGTAWQGGDLGISCSEVAHGGCGLVFKIDAAGHEAVLHAFTGLDDGGLPYSGVIRDAAGNLYGTTARGGKKGLGVVFKFDASGNETVLHNFAGGPDGSLPDSSVTLDAGYLYGTTECGGTGGQSRFCDSGAGAGTVFKLDSSGHETILYNFTGGADGSYPQAGVVLDPAGNIYGTSYAGTTDGVAFRLSPAGQFTILHSFNGGTDGGFPSGNLFLDAAGDLYGETSGGGKGSGTIFTIDAAGQFSVIYRFTGQPDGSWPAWGLIPGALGGLHGVTYKGGAANLGTVFRLDGSGKVTILYSF